MATPQDRRVNARGLSFHYVEWGAATQPPLLCLHGITQTAHSWDEVAARSCRATIACCASTSVATATATGHPTATTRGRRRPPTSMPSPTRSACRQFILAGMSMGGINSITFTARHPEKVRALIIVDVSPEIQVKGVENIRSFIQAPDELDSFEAFVERAHQFNPRRSLENIRSRLSHNLKQLPNGKWTWKYDKALRSRGTQLPSQRLAELVGRCAGHPLPDADHQRGRERHPLRRERREAAGGDSRRAVSRSCRAPVIR